MSNAEFSPSPITKQSLSDEVVFQIKEMIADGRLQPGQRLPTEQELCNGFSVSRATVREALKALTTLGLVERKKHNVYVTDSVQHPLREFYLHLMVDNYDISQIYESRMLLEGSMVRLTCLRITPEQIEQLEEFNRGMQSEDLECYIKNDVAFHNMLIQATGNRVLYEMYQVIRFLLEKAQMETIQDSESRAVSRMQHHHILEAVKARDPDRAEALMNEHIRFLMGVRERILREKEEKLLNKN